jgi:L-aminopeptidase/D-esterase-like protein
MGYQASVSASSVSPAQGNVGAGAGATVGKMFGMKLAMKSGLGTSSIPLGGGVIVGAIVAVNPYGDVVDPKTGNIIAGLRSGKLGPLKIGDKQNQFADTLTMMKHPVGRGVLGIASLSNTVIGVVATNAKLTKAQATKVAQMAQDGIAKTIRPAHTMFDGDVIFALSTGTKKADISTVGAYAAEAMSQAIIRGVESAKSAGGVPGLNQA